MRRIVAVAIIVAGLAHSAAAEVAGRGAVVIDGDTIELDRRRLRLHGVDAPERDQTCGAAAGPDWPCGAAATARLAALVAGKRLRCGARDQDRYGRLVVACDAEGVDLGAALVTEGLAWAYLRYSRDYAAQQAQARARRLGVWAGPSVAAWTWRRGAGFRPAAEAPPAGDQSDATATSAR